MKIIFKSTNRLIFGFLVIITGFKVNAEVLAIAGNNIDKTVTKYDLTKVDIYDKNVYPVARVAKVLDNLMLEIQANPNKYAKSANAYELLKGKFLEGFSVKKLSANVMGKFYRQSSKEERQIFYNAFLKNLFNTYVSVFLDPKKLATIHNDFVLIFDNDIRYTNKNKTKGFVDFTAEDISSGKKVKVSLTMFKGKNGWQGENIIAEGVNLGLNYRSQFYDLMSKNSNNIKKVAMIWQGIKTDEDTKE